MLNFKEALPLSLYIHLPWCVKKCPYCDFNSHEAKDSDLDEQTYIDALIRDIDSELPRIWGRTISSVFIGGGTPSLFSAEALDKLLSALRARLNIMSGIEITLEANPGTAEAEKFKAYHALGINRLSIGVQSFADEKLKSLGRVHNSNEALMAISMARNAGFENINIDLMFGLPEQKISEAMQDLNLAIEQAVSHISWYQLTIEPNTVFNAKPPSLPSEDYIWEMQNQGQALLSESAYGQYEISAYAKNKKYCQHNLNYWEFGDYLGVGAGAHGKITNIAAGKVERFQRHKIPARYIELTNSGAAVTETKVLTRDDMVLEFMMNAMRLKNGVSSHLFMERTGLPLTVMEKKLSKAEEQGLIDWQRDELKPTDKGFHYLNELLGIFLS